MSGRDEKGSGEILSYFQKNHYTGDRSQWMLFHDEVKTAILNKVGEQGTRLLFTKWPLDPTDPAKYIMDREFTKLPIPEPFAEDEEEMEDLLPNGDRQYNDNGTVKMKEITEAMRTRRKDARAHAIQFNKDLNSTIVDCQRILSERCSKLFNIKFNEFGGNPVRCWQYLATHCGPASLGNSDVSSVFVRFIEMKMEPSQRLSEFLIEWDKLREYTKCNNDIARALLLSDAKIGKYGIQVLPDRLKDAVRRCKDDDKTYDECRQYLLTKDDQAHAAGDLPGNSKRANAVYCQEAGGVKRPTHVAVIDTGCEENCVKSEESLSYVEETYDEDNTPDLMLTTASGDSMNVTAKGGINNIMDEVYAVKELETTLISGPRLQDKNMWIILPPTSISKDIGAIVTDCDGKIQMLGDKSMLTDINKMGTYKLKIVLPDVSPALGMVR